MFSLKGIFSKRSIWGVTLEAVKKPSGHSDAVQSQKAVSAHFTSGQRLPFGFAERSGRGVTDFVTGVF